MTVYSNLKPLISIITVCYNSEDTIAKQLKVLLTKDIKIEFIIIDGKSEDKTLYYK